MEMQQIVADEAPMYDGRFRLHEAVQITIEQEAGQEVYEDQPAWQSLGAFCTGLVMAYPDIPQAQLAGLLNIMPDEPLPKGNRYATIHPRLFSQEPFVHIMDNGEEVKLRYAIEPLNDGGADRVD